MCVVQSFRVLSTQILSMQAMVAQIIGMQIHCVHNNFFSPGQYFNLDVRGNSNSFSPLRGDIYFQTIGPQNILKYYFSIPWRNVTSPCHGWCDKRIDFCHRFGSGDTTTE